MDGDVSSLLHPDDRIGRMTSNSGAVWTDLSSVNSLRGLVEWL